VGVAGCAHAARRTGGRERQGWIALAVACGSWAAGQGAWTVYESVLDVDVPYPSLADLGYLGFPVAALLGFVRLAPPTSTLATPRRVLDGLMVGCALTLLAWLGVVQAVLAESTGPPLGNAVSLAYPAADVVLLTVAVLTVAQTRDDPVRWTLLIGGVLAMALADGAFLYQASMDTYQTGTVVDRGWWTGFSLIGLAGLLVTGRPAAPRPTRSSSTAVRAGVLPYVPLAAAATTAGVRQVTGTGLDTVAVALIAAVVATVLVRQYVTVRENQELTRELRQREVQLHHLAFHDGLTGLANRALFLDRLGHALDLGTRRQRSVSVAFLDLDGFKAVNDSLGHAAGDALLVRVAERLRGALRTSDTLSRLGGDEFAVLVEEGDDAAGVARGLLEALRAPFHLDGRTVTISASVGVATVEPGLGAAHAANLLHRADVAMYAVKTTGKGDVLVHSPALDLAARTNEPALHRAFAAALDNGAVRAVYQPVVDPRTGMIHAVEALARWNHEGLEIPPGTFLPICEKAGLSEHLTAVILEQACAQLAAWNRGLGHRGMVMAVNVNPTEFSDPAMPDRIARLVDRHALAPGQLALEITEVALANRPDSALDVMHRLRALGLRLAIDDFGTGYSTLARLAQAPVDTLKVDRFFLADVDHDPRRRRFLAGLLDLGQQLGLHNIVEGVERPAQLRTLQQLRCDLVQGHLVVPPTPGPELTPLLLAGRSVLPPALLPRSVQLVAGSVS
jgi:diguanylate cyclase (GGDEF)-like protein